MVELMISSFGHVLQLAGLIVSTLILGVVTQFVYKKFSNQAKLKELNDLIKELQDKIKSSEDSEEKLKLQSKVLSLSQSKFQHTMKPMLLSNVIFIVSLPALRYLFEDFVLLKWTTEIPLIHTDMGWLLTYILISLFTSSFIRKKMGVKL